MKINGTEIAKRILLETQHQISSKKLKLKLAIILASDDAPSKMYVNLKKKRANEIGIEVDIIEFGKTAEFQDIKSTILDLNNDKSVTGIMIQLPSYNELGEYKAEILNLIKPEKDVDGLTYTQLGKVSHLVKNSFPPATVEAILECINVTYDFEITWKSITTGKIELDNTPLTGLNILIINNSDLIGKPLSLILASLNATVTVANKHTGDLRKLCKEADMVISATGQTQLFSHNDIKKDSVVIDVTSKKIAGEILGDFIQSPELENKARAITPVPGGVGPVTIACLLRNVVRTIDASS